MAFVVILGALGGCGSDSGKEEAAAPQAPASTGGNEFVLTKAADATLNRTCTRKGEGGCPSAGNDW